METNELNKMKVKYFFENDVCVHITKKNNYIHNGFILQYAGDYLILDDEVNGAIPIYFIEIKEIEKRKEKNDK